MRALLASLLLACLAAPACSQTPVVVPLRSMERPRDVDFICLQAMANGTWEGVSLEKCALDASGNQVEGANGNFRLHALVTQQSRGELAVVDLGKLRGDAAALLKVDPRVPGYSFIPVGAAPTDIVADPSGKVVFVSSGRDPRIEVLPSGLLRGPIDTTASVDPPPWPHLDFDRATEGIPSAMSIHREGNTRRLFVTLPDATPSAKIAVFDLTTNPLVPSRVGDIALTAPDAAPLPWQPVRCGPYAGDFDPAYFGATKPTKETWWAAYDRCASEKPKTPVGAETVDPANNDFHYAGVALAGGKLFVADDRVPVVHVFDVSKGKGIEIRRIAVGAPTSRLAVSPPVPDEVSIENVAGVDVCTANGWLGDGRDHSADSSTVKTQLGGRCRLHRYIYGVDLVNNDAGPGSIAVVDVPITYKLDDKGAIELKDDPLGGEKIPAEERLDIDGAELSQPMACDSPTFPARRLPLGPFAVGGVNVVPARTISFVTNDPTINNITVNGAKLRAARCRGWAPGTYPRASASVRDLDAADGVSPEQRAARIAAGEAFRTDVGPRRLRGVFAFVALSNGALVMVDVDDYDATCRGPTDSEKRGSNNVPETLFLHPDEQPFTLTNAAVGEWFPRAVKRHHPRSLRTFTRDTLPVASTPTLSRYNNVLSNDPATLTGYAHPHFAGLEKQDPAEPRPVTIAASPDNPYALSTEAWAITFEGALPGFQGAYGALQEGAKLEFVDPEANFCRKGVESDGALETHDVVQLLDPVCAFDDRCSPADKNACVELFGTETAQPLPKSRSLLIEKAHDGRLVLANKRFVRTGGAEEYALQDGAPDIASIKRCFGSTVGGNRVLPLLKYAIRSTGSWIVNGGVTGFLHRKIVDPKSTDQACVTDLSRPRIMNGRVRELPALPSSVIDKAPPYADTAGTYVVSDICQQFVNPTWRFAIRAGGAPSKQDMRFTFSGRFAWQPLALAAGSLAASMRPVAGHWDGKERLNWSMIAVVDAIDRGLLVFPTDTPFAFQKGAN